MKIAIFEGYNGPGTIKYHQYGTPAAPARPYAGLHGFGDATTIATDATECSCSWSKPFLAGIAVAVLWPFAVEALGIGRAYARRHSSRVASGT